MNREASNQMAAKEWAKSTDNPYRAVEHFSGLLSDTTNKLKQLRQAVVEMGYAHDASQDDLLELESKLLDLEILVLKLKRFFTNLEIGAS